MLQLTREGVVLCSNGRLERELGQAVQGRSFVELLDADSSALKWSRALGGRNGSDGDALELILDLPGTPGEPRPFSVLRDEPDDVVWLIEHPRDERLDALGRQMTDVNTELANAQRALVRERAQLARALAELEVRNRELAATTEELARSNRALDEFAHVVSHDLKAPLRGIGNFAAFAREDGGDALSDDARANLGRIDDQVRRMRAMIDGVLAYARAGRDRSKPEMVDTRELVAGIVALLAPPEGVEVRIAGEMPVLLATRAALQQVLQNLIDNAIKHARRADPCIEIGATARDSEWEFSVRDNGPGIALGARERVWELFRTGTADPTGRNTGIGLAVVRRIVERERGRAWVESEEGEGATFHFTWPMTETSKVAGHD